MKYKILLLTIVVSVCLVTTRASIADDWNQWRGPSQNGKSRAKGYFGKEPFSLSLVWKKHIGPAYSGVSVSNGKLFVPFGDGTSDWLAAYDTKTGQQLWKHRLGKMYPAHDGGHDGPLSTPVADDKTVFILAPRGAVEALDLATGKPRWRVDLVKQFAAHRPFWGFCTTPAITDTSLIVQTTGKSGHGVVAFDKTDGSVQWKQNAGQTDYRSPVMASILSKQQLIACTRGETCGLNPSSGEKFWSKRVSSVTEMTPVPVQDNRVLLTKRGGVEMIRISQSGGVSSLWSNSEFRGNYGTPVYHDGFLFGFSSHALTCVNAKTGRRVWRSRGPGGGKGLIVVDGHLVIFGVKGDVIVAKASGEGYVERARIKVSSADGYSAPIFSDGMIFARDLSGSIFAVKAVKSASSAVATEKPKTQFAKFIASLEDQDDKQAAIDGFLASQKSHPIVEDQRWVHFVYQGKAEDVAIRGSMIASGEEDSLERVGGTDFYYRTYEIEPGARWEYTFVIDFRRRIRDPLNPKRGYRDSNASELITEGWSEPKWTAKYQGEKKGRIETMVYSGGTASVYLPPGYSLSGINYPLIVVAEGLSWLSQGQARDVLDQLNEAGSDPAIVAFVSGSGGRDHGGANTASFAKRMSGSLIKAIDGKYRTRKNRESRTIVGKRGAAVAAVYTALQHPDVYGNCIAITYGRADTVRKNAIAKMAKDLKGDKPEFHIAWNRYEVWRPQSFSCRDQSRDVTKLLKDNGFKVSGGERNDTSDWRSWRILFGQAIE